MARPQRAKESGLPQLEFPTSMCLVCGGPARSFTSVEVPELAAYLRRELEPERLAEAVRARLKLSASACAFAWKCGISVCAPQGKVA